MAQNVAENATVSEGVVTNPVEENVNEVNNTSENVSYKNIIKK